MTNETARKDAEDARVANEAARQSAEATRQSNEQSRQTAEQGRVEAEQARAEEFAGFGTAIAAKEDAANKVTSINADADDVHYPSAKAVKDVKNEITEAITTLDAKVNALALGKFYGYFPESKSLPADAITPGYAYVGTDNPYKIYNFNGEAWSDSGTSIDTISNADEESIYYDSNDKLSIKPEGVSIDKLGSDVISKLNKVDNICVQVTDYPGIDFTTKFQNAINDTSVKSLTILIPPGSYTLSSKLVVPSDAKPFKIVGQPSHSTNGSNIITAPNGFIESRNSGAIAIEIEGISLIGGAASVGISLSSRWAKVHNIFMRGYSVGIDFDCAYGVISDVQVYNCEKGVITTPTGTIIQNCHINSCSVAGIETDGGNALSVNGCIFEDNDIHININTTDFVDICRSYVGDKSTIVVKNTGGTNINIHDMLQSIGGPGVIVEQSAGSMKISGKYYSISGGINLSGGVLDLSELKMHLGRYFINRTGGGLVMNASKYQVGYKLIVDGDDVTEPSNMRGYIEKSAELNYAGLPKWNIMSEIKDINPNVNFYKPGVQFHFKFPKYLVGQKVYLFHQGIANRQPYDLFVKGGRFVELSAFLLATLNVISDNRIRLPLNSYPFHNIPITLDSEDLYITFVLNNTGDTRDVASVIDFLYVSEDNSFCYPTEWASENSIS